MMDGAMEKLDRRKVLAAVLKERGNTLVVPGLGTANYDLFAVSPADENAYMWNAMGLTVSVGLGLAVAQPARRVLVVTGDGEMMMGIGSLCVVAAQAAKNLGILVLDNEMFEETGAQTGLSAARADISRIALGAGFEKTMIVRSHDEAARLADFLLKEEGPVLAVAKVTPSAGKPVYPTMDGPGIVRTFRAAVLGQA
jgi:thiamine pyrophosphate-dependent acetolactate synthase large subunit-like protein